jgi:hypothetical protein
MRAVLLILCLYLATTDIALAARDKFFGMDPDQFVKIGAVYLSRGEVVSLLKGRTELWDTGGKAFYGAGGKLSLRFEDGLRAEGSWSVSSDGTMCTKVAGPIKGSNYCHGYVRFKGNIYYVWRGTIRAIQRTRSGKAF